MNTQDKDLIRGLLTELVNEETALGDAKSQFAAARVRFDVASRKYAAVRDMVTAQLGHSPYMKSFKWPVAVGRLGANLGQYRFTHMKPGDAIIAALKEGEEPLALEQIVERLSSGGIRFPKSMLTRMVNAALMKTAGIEKTKNGKYIYPKEKPEDIPFES